MTMYAEDIYTAASAICGEKSELLGLLCTAAEEELQFRLKKDVDIKSIESLFIAAAAMLAASMYAETAVDSEVKSYSVGNVSVAYGDKSGLRSSALRSRAEAILSGYIDDGGFEFMGVDG